jgi:hypothetical protein
MQVAGADRERTRLKRVADRAAQAAALIGWFGDGRALSHLPPLRKSKLVSAKTLSVARPGRHILPQLTGIDDGKCVVLAVMIIEIATGILVQAKTGTPAP